MKLKILGLCALFFNQFYWLVSGEDHTTLEDAIVTVGLAETFSGEGPFTIFAPTDDAFKTLPPASLGALFVNASGG